MQPISKGAVIKKIKQELQYIESTLENIKETIGSNSLSRYDQADLNEILRVIENISAAADATEMTINDMG